MNSARDGCPCCWSSLLRVDRYVTLKPEESNEWRMQGIWLYRERSCGSRWVGSQPGKRGMLDAGVWVRRVIPAKALRRRSSAARVIGTSAPASGGGASVKRENSSACACRYWRNGETRVASNMMSRVITAVDFPTYSEYCNRSTGQFGSHSLLTSLRNHIALESTD